MLEEARELMIKTIEKYGLNDEATLACSILVDKILNKEGGSKMRSEADVIYNHIVRSKSDEVVAIESDYIDNFIHTLTQYTYKTSKNIFKEEIEKHEAIKKAEFNAIVLGPYFARESEKWAKNIGVDIRYWSDSEHEKFKNYFMEKYKGLIR